MTKEQIAALYKNHGPSVYRRCLYLLGNEQEALDALQEIFLRIIDKGNFRGESSPTTWIYRITTNACLNRLRDRKSWVDLRPQDLVESSPQARCEARQLIRALQERLDSSSLEIAVLYYLDNLAQEEIEEILKVSRRTIGKRLKKIQALCQQLSVRGRGVEA